jgi:phosphinothricin acetyltransferase
VAALTFRRAGEGDNFAAILALVQECFAYMEARIDPPSSMHRMTAESVRAHAFDEEVWVAEDETGGLAACVFFTCKPAEAGNPGRLYLGKMAVRPSFRGRGLARLMVEKACERAAALGLPVLELQSRIELLENHRAFERLGFIKTGESSHAGFDRPTSITMQRRAG